MVITNVDVSSRLRSCAGQELSTYDSIAKMINSLIKLFNWKYRSELRRAILV